MVLSMLGSVYNSGLSPNSRAAAPGGYRSPFEPPTLSIAFRTLASSSLVKVTSTDLMFSSRYLTRFVPGIGITSGIER